MAEHEPRHPEHAEHRAEHQRNLETAAQERLEHLKRHAESAPETPDADRRAEAAREVIHHQEHAPEPEPAAAAEAESHHRPAHHILLNPKLNYAQTLASVQHHLTPVSRTFSRVIHAPAIERASEAIENTVARPSVTAGAAWTALIIGAVFYFTARRYGYALSGSEVEASFLVGAVLGLVIEWCWRKFFRRPHHK